MDKKIIYTARERASKSELPYAGAVTPQEAWDLIEKNSNIVLIDVRTNAERDWIGRVRIPDKQHLTIQWSTYPGGVANSDFIKQLSELVSNKETSILFLCRSGVRSRHAAKLATEHGYSNCYDILEGFEGDKDSNSHRKTVGGWCFHQLPWIGA